MANYSPLFDDLLLNNHIANPIKPFSQRLSKINWLNVSINMLIPAIIILILAFILKSRYDKKKQLYEEYYVVNPPTKSVIF